MNLRNVKFSVESIYVVVELGGIDLLSNESNLEFMGAF